MSDAARWVIYSTFDAGGAAAGFAVDQVRSYRDAGFEVLVVDTSPVISAPRRQDWERHASRWLVRENSGHDFGSYQAGLRHLLEHETNASRPALILANDSCFGPFVPFRDVIGSFARFPIDRKYVFGITDSFQDGVHHLQSYWLYFRPDVSQLAFQFFETMPLAKNRDEAIAFGELALSRFLVERGCVLQAACPVTEAVSALAREGGVVRSAFELGVRRIFKRWKYNRAADTQCLRHVLRRPSKIHFFNPSILFAVPLFRQGKLPLVKRSLLTQNIYDDPIVRPGTDTSRIDNAELARMLASPRRRSR